LIEKSLLDLEVLQRFKVQAQRLVQLTYNLESRMKVSIAPRYTEHRYKVKNNISLKGKNSVFKTFEIVEKSKELTFDPLEYKLVGLPRTFYDILGISLILDDLPPYLSLEVRLYLEKEILRRNRPFEQRVLITKILTAPNQVDLYLRQQSARWLFGHFLPKIRESLQKIKLVHIRPSDVCKPQRIRGYRDHGTLLPESKWEEHHDVSFTEEQRQLEADDHIVEVLSMQELLLFNRKTEDAQLGSPKADIPNLRKSSFFTKD